MEDHNKVPPHTMGDSCVPHAGGRCHVGEESVRSMAVWAVQIGVRVDHIRRSLAGVLAGLQAPGPLTSPPGFGIPPGPYRWLHKDLPAGLQTLQPTRTRPLAGLQITRAT